MRNWGKTDDRSSSGESDVWSSQAISEEIAGWAFEGGEGRDRWSRSRIFVDLIQWRDGWVEGFRDQEEGLRQERPGRKVRLFSRTGQVAKLRRSSQVLVGDRERQGSFAISDGRHPESWSIGDVAPRGVRRASQGEEAQRDQTEPNATASFENGSRR